MIPDSGRSMEIIKGMLKSELARCEMVLSGLQQKLGKEAIIYQRKIKYLKKLLAVK